METQSKSGSRNGKTLRSSQFPLDRLPGIAPEDLTRLLDRNIRTTADLLRSGSTPAKRGQLARDLQLHIHHVNKWIALADLARIPSVGCQYCGLLLHSGIASPMQLSQTPLGRLHRQILKLYVATMQRRDLCPTIDQVDRWISEAKLLR